MRNIDINAKIAIADAKTTFIIARKYLDKTEFEIIIPEKFDEIEMEFILQQLKETIFQLSHNIDIDPNKVMTLK